MIPHPNGCDTQHVEDCTNDEVYPKAQLVKLDHGVACKRAKDCPRKCYNIENRLSIAPMFVRDYFSDSG
jgi:hypothetical protein